MTEMSLQISKQSATLRGLVEEKLRMAIATGMFKPGQRLIERELCETLGVGRTSVREAFRHLEAEGLITNVPHRGPVVSTMSPEEVEQLYDLRALLEGYAGRRCATRTDGAFHDRMDRAVDVFAKSAVSDDREALAKAKAEFYDLLLEGSGNPMVRQTLLGLYNRISMLRMTTMTQPGRLQRSIAEIREIASAIRAGDPVRAETACRRHIEEAAKIALGYLENASAA